MPDSELIHSVLVLAFAPTIHRTYREVCAWFRGLEPEDIAQQIFDILPGTSRFCRRSKTLLAFCQSPFPGAYAKPHSVGRKKNSAPCLSAKMKPKPTPSAAIERLSLPSKHLFLNDFLDYCTRRGLLSPFEREILIRFKVDGFTYKEIQNRHTVLTDQAVRLRVHRIMQRLQEAALTLGTGTDGLNNASRQVTPTSQKKAQQR